MKKFWWTILAIGLALVAGNFFFARYYWNDKNSTALWITERMAATGSLIAHDVPCNEGAGLSVKATWAEEPPVFHGAALLLKAAGLSDVYAKILPLLISLALYLSLARLVRFLQPEAEESPAALGLLLAFLPFFYIHASRFLPDTLMTVFVAWFLLALVQGRMAWAVFWAFLAVTTKATAIFLVASAWGGYALVSKEALRVKFLRGVLLASSALPMLAWMYFLRETNIDNPFFGSGNEVDVSRYAGGGHFGSLFPKDYWARFATWVVVRGVSIPIFAFFLYAAWRCRRQLAEHRLLLITAAGIIPYWLVVRGGQYTAPHYSFPFFVPIVALGLSELFQVRNRYARWAVLVFLLAVSIPKLEYSLKPAETFAAPASAAPVQLRCDL